MDASYFCLPEAVVSGQLYSRHPSFRLQTEQVISPSCEWPGQWLSRPRCPSIFSQKKYNNLPILGVPGQKNRSSIEDRRLAGQREESRLDNFYLPSLRWLRWCAKSCRLRTPRPRSRRQGGRNSNKLHFTYVHVRVEFFLNDWCERYVGAASFHASPMRILCVLD